MLEYQFYLLLQSHGAYVYGGMVDKFNINTSSVTIKMPLCNPETKKLLIFLRQYKLYFLFCVCIWLDYLLSGEKCIKSSKLLDSLFLTFFIV